MISDIDIAAPLAAMLFLSLCMGMVACFAVIVQASLTRHPERARRALVALLTGCGLYVLVLLGYSSFSKERVLGRGVEKYFCELDCHLAYSIASVEHQGDRLLVKLRTRFDETTISARRPKDVPLTPNQRELYLVDEEGGTHAPERVAMRNNPPLSTPLEPGESYETLYVFIVPRNAGGKLFLQNEPWPSSLLIGHENSPLHRKVYFQL